MPLRLWTWPSMLTPPSAVSPSAVEQIVWRAALLGTGCGVGVLTTLHASESWRVFGWYLTALSVFHFSEYFTTAVTNPKSLSLDSFLLNHSREYGVAAACSWVEFLVERSLFPGTSPLRVSLGRPFHP